MIRWINKYVNDDYRDVERLYQGSEWARNVFSFLVRRLYKQFILFRDISVYWCEYLYFHSLSFSLFLFLSFPFSLSRVSMRGSEYFSTGMKDFGTKLFYTQHSFVYIEIWLFNIETLRIRSGAKGCSLLMLRLPDTRGYLTRGIR